MTGELLGLDYAGVRALASMLRLRLTPDDVGKLRTLEDETLKIRKERRGRG